MPKLDLDLFLNAEDIGEKSEVTVVDEGGNIDKKETGFDEDSFNITVKLPSGDKRSYTMNKTSQRSVARLYGIDTKNWINKKLTLITKDVNVKGTMRKAIFVQIVEPAGQTGAKK